MKLRKGDGPKAIVLCVLIAATVWFIYHTLAQSPSRPVATGAPSSSARQPGTLQVQGQAQAGKPMFAARPQVSAGLLRIASTPDPFQPAVSDQSAATAATAAARRAPSVLRSRPAPPLPGSPERELSNVRLAGVVMTPSPLAVLQEGEYRQLVRRGDLLAGGWRVGAITSQEVSLDKGGKRVTLRLGGDEQRRPSQPLPVLRPGG